MSQVLLGTVAIESTRWDRSMPARDDRASARPILLADWMDAIASAGFDGIELWERHLLDAERADRDRVVAHALPIRVWNSYVSLDDDDDASRIAIAAEVARVGATGIKFNVGNDVAQLDSYADRIGRWLDVLPSSVRLLCECHHTTSIAEEPSVAARIFEMAGSADRVQAIVHTNESDDHLRQRFDAYGARITHVHVNFLDFITNMAPALSEIEDLLAKKVALLQTLGFNGSWTIEFCHGLLTERDRPDFLIAQAAADLGILRTVLGERAG